MIIFFNEQQQDIPDHQTLGAFQKQWKPDADVLIVNGHPGSSEQQLHEGDRIWLVRRGEQPSPAEMEALLIARHTPGVHDKIKNACIGIAGIGGLGSQVAIALARVGIGCLILGDFDVVEPTNLNRQQYFIDQIGMYKVNALADNIRRINPATRIITHQTRICPENIDKLFFDINIMVEAFDAPDQKAMLASYWLKNYRHKPLVTGSGMAGYGPSNTISTVKISHNFYLCGDQTSAAQPGTGLMAPRVGIVAHHQANTVLRLLLDQNPESMEYL